MTQIVEPWKDEQNRKLVDLITPDVKKVLIFFWHGLGDAIMFREPFAALIKQFPEVLFDITVEEGLGQEDVIPGAIPLTLEEAGEFNQGRTPKRFQGYDLIAKINMPMSEGQDDYTKAEWCCLTELGIEPVCGHPPLAQIARLVGVHFHLTALPESGGIPYDMAEQIWGEIIEAGFTPIELLMQHKWHNPVNEKYDFVDRHIRDWPAEISVLATLLQDCEAYIGSLGGNFHLALSVMPPERIIALERDFTVPMYTKLPVARVNIKEYENGTVKDWLKEL